MAKFNIEITDTFGGEANYSWVRRYTYEAKSFLGAINKLAREYGSGWRKNYDCFDYARYDFNGSCICCFISYSED